jgi:hypothetical protein
MAHLNRMKPELLPDYGTLFKDPNTFGPPDTTALTSDTLGEVWGFSKLTALEMLDTGYLISKGLAIELRVIWSNVLAGLIALRMLMRGLPNYKVVKVLRVLAICLVWPLWYIVGFILGRVTAKVFGNRFVWFGGFKESRNGHCE